MLLSPYSIRSDEEGRGPSLVAIVHEPVWTLFYSCSMAIAFGYYGFYQFQSIAEFGHDGVAGLIGMHHDDLCQHYRGSKYNVAGSECNVEIEISLEDPWYRS